MTCDSGTDVDIGEVALNGSGLDWLMGFLSCFF